MCCNMLQWASVRFSGTCWFIPVQPNALCQGVSCMLIHCPDVPGSSQSRESKIPRVMWERHGCKTHMHIRSIKTTQGEHARILITLSSHGYHAFSFAERFRFFLVNETWINMVIKTTANSVESCKVPQTSGKELSWQRWATVINPLQSSCTRVSRAIWNESEWGQKFQPWTWGFR